jgi:putative tryptophan/tyrosine transport system substrate-binding protein
MRRREFIGLVGSTVAWPLALRAQQGRVRRVGVFMDLAESDVEGQARVAAFRRGMSELGWEEGRNVRFEYRWTAGDPVLMRRYAAALVDLGPEVIMNGGLPTLAAMQQETRTIPIVFAQVLDPVGGGFVDSLARPGGNITGFVSFEYSMAGKWLETLKAVAPHITRVAAIRDLASPSEMGMLGVMQTIMPAFSMPLIVIGGRDGPEFERVIDTFAREHDRPAEPQHSGAASCHHEEGGATSTACDLSLRVLCEGGRADVIRHYPLGQFPSSRRICRSHPEGHEPQRNARSGAEQV